MKKIFIVALAFVIVAMSLTGCSSKGKTLMSLDGSEISVNMFQLFLSRQKGMLCSSYGYGTKALADSFWDTVMDVSGTTYNDYYTELVLENTKTYLAALKLFDEKGLKLPDSYVDEIDAELDRLVEQDGSGSKSKFNSVLAEFGVNYNILREAYIIEAKISYLQNELFGVGGSKISEQLIEDYFSQQYVRFKQVFLYTYGTVYETDENGDSIFFNEDGTVAYDTTQIPKKDADGNFVKDSKGNVIYVTEDGKIAYDQKAGNRKAIVDASGNVVTEDFSAQKINMIKEDAKTIMSEAEKNDFVKFDALVEEHSLDSGMEKYPNGIYLTEMTEYDSPEVVKALFEMEVGEIRLVQSQYGFHVIMKYDLGDKPYENDENADFFINEKTGEYIFMDDLISRLFADYLEQYKSNIVVNRELFETVDMKSVGPNFYY